jgi:hypothetical protein
VPSARKKAPVRKVVAVMATSTVVSLSPAPAAESVPASPAAITARMPDEASCVLPITAGIRLVSDVPIIRMAAVTSAKPSP